jgi:hypothetical protein
VKLPSEQKYSHVGGVSLLNDGNPWKKSERQLCEKETDDSLGIANEHLPVG